MSIKNCILSFIAMAASLLTAFDATIPVLDMNDYFDPQKKAKFVKELYTALHEDGFFALINAGVDKKIMDESYQACFDFFALPQEKKKEVFDPSLNGQRGYVAGESPKGTSKADFKEFYHIGREMSQEDLKRLQLLPNLWPQNFSFKEPLSALYSALEKDMIPLQQAMAEAIGAESDLFTQMTREGDVLLRAIHYPASPPKNQFWAGEHTDIDLFTILPRATAEGLQLQNKNGDWIDIVVPENAFIINAGDMLENITNGEFKSGMHRVIAKSDGYERYSVVFFVHPQSDTPLGPLSECIERTGSFCKYANATRLELLEERLVDLGLASYPMMQHLANSGLMERLIAVKRASPKAMKKLAEVGLASDAVLKELIRFEEK